MSSSWIHHKNTLELLRFKQSCCWCVRFTTPLEAAFQLEGVRSTLEIGRDEPLCKWEASSLQAVSNNIQQQTLHVWGWFEASHGLQLRVDCLTFEYQAWWLWPNLHPVWLTDSFQQVSATVWRETVCWRLATNHSTDWPHWLQHRPGKTGASSIRRKFSMRVSGERVPGTCRNSARCGFLFSSLVANIHNPKPI